jgi:hypothetical protein
MEHVEHRMRHGVHGSRNDSDHTQQPLAGQRCCGEHHRQGEIELADVAD